MLLGGRRSFISELRISRKKHILTIVDIYEIVESKVNNKLDIGHWLPQCSPIALA
jgi:hypothetical protein